MTRKGELCAGLRDYGTSILELETSEATDDFLFIIVGMTGHWKLSTAYVPQDKCSASGQSQLIKDYISVLYVERVDVLAVVFGTFTNHQTAVQL